MSGVGGLGPLPESGARTEKEKSSLHRQYRLLALQGLGDIAELTSPSQEATPIAPEHMKDTGLIQDTNTITHSHSWLTCIPAAA